jgi:hypothetical protein
MSEWISVKLCPLPEEGEFLVYLSDPLTGMRIHSLSICMVANGSGGESPFRVVGGIFGYDAPNITHWMPLPEPPK